MKRVLGALLAAFALSASPASAHTTLERASPASGSVLAESPDQVTLSFGEPTRLTAVSVTTASGDRRVEFTPAGSATTFTVAAPELAPGRNEIVWRALSRDGHPVQGSIIIVIRPPAQ